MNHHQQIGTKTLLKSCEFNMAGMRYQYLKRSSMILRTGMHWPFSFLQVYLHKETIFSWMMNLFKILAPYFCDVWFTFSGICSVENGEAYGSYGEKDGLYCLDPGTSGYNLECQISDYYYQVYT